MTDVSSGFTVTALMQSRSMSEVTKMISIKWFDVHGRPQTMSGDPEFDNETIRLLCSRFNVEYQPRPARRHNKIGSVESGNQTIRLFV